MEHARYKTRSSSATPRPRRGRPILLHTPNGLEVPLVSQSTVFPRKLRQTPLTWGTISKATTHFHGSGCTLPHLQRTGWLGLPDRTPMPSPGGCCSGAASSGIKKGGPPDIFTGTLGNRPSTQQSLWKDGRRGSCANMNDFLKPQTSCGVGATLHQLVSQNGKDQQGSAL